MSVSRFLSRSLLGHVVLFEIIFGLPAIISGLFSNSAEGTLTAEFAIEMVLEVAALTAIGACAIWYVVTLPLIKRTRR